MILDPKKVSVAEFHQFMLGTVAPRPIAFASTIDKNGNVNLSPFSFFNCFSANPPILIFSPSRRVRDNTIKHTLENVYEVEEVCINMVNYDLVQQASLASTEYEKGVNEFFKAGLTPVPSEIIKPPRVKESPVSYECKVKEVIALGNEKGAGNLIICEVLLAHFDEHILNEQRKIDPDKIDLVARMGYDYYCRASGNAVFEVQKPLQRKGIGVDQIPDEIRWSKVLTGNDLGRLGNVEYLPSDNEVYSMKDNLHIQKILAGLAGAKDGISIKEALHFYAKQLLESGSVNDAWCVLLLSLTV